MAVVEVSYEDLSSLIGVKIERQELMESITMFGTPVEEEEGDLVRIEVFPNRPDMLSVEGIARSMRQFLGKKKGLPIYKLSSPNLEVKIKNPAIRQACSFCVIKNVNLSNAAVASLMQLQEKLHTTHGRRRAKVAIGVHDLDKIEGPITYGDELKSQIEFVPLGEKESLTAEKILNNTSKGRAYAHLLPGEKAPVIRDRTGEVLSLPPIINGEYSKVEPSTRNIFLDVTGTDERAVEKAAIIVAASLAERGAEIELVKVGERLAPDFTPQTMELETDYVNKLLGLELDDFDVIELLSKMGMAKFEGSFKIPAYRTDIMHPIDLVEDVAISYGYPQFKREILSSKLSGEIHPSEELAETLRLAMVGLGFQEVYTFILTNPELLFEKMGEKRRDVPEIENPTSQNFTIVRDTVLPSLLEILSSNTHNSYPQKIFEIGEVCKLDEKEVGSSTERRLSGVFASSDANFTEVKGIVEAVSDVMGWKAEFQEADHPSFIEGRAASSEKVIFGEIHPRVLSEFGIDVPVAAFEFKIPYL